MTNIFFEKHKLSSFDKSYSTEVFLKSPDKYKQLEKDSLKTENLISRGSGYSYVAASFKKETLSIDMKNFNRILYFDKKRKLITVESGITVAELLDFTLSFGLWIPQIPGYPFISIGGAVASNVHGKSGGTHGTIRNVVRDILIFHKSNGWLNLSKDKNQDIFDLTIGGYGLTGTIVSVTLNLIDFDGLGFETSISKIHSINETVNYIKDRENQDFFIYSWNKINSNLKNFGEGLIFSNKIISEGNKKKLKFVKNNSKKNLLYFSLWNKLSVKIFNYIFFKYYSSFKQKTHKDTFNNVIFPFFGKEFYFYFFGRNGFFESQILINSEKIEYFIGDFKKLLNQHNPIITLFSLKGMSGEQKYLRFEGKMICLTFDLVKSKKSLNFLNALDNLYIKYEIVPSIIKDSRIKKEVFNKCYKFADQFRNDLRKFDPKRSYRSELSDRLEL